MKSSERLESGLQQTYDYGSLLDRWFEVYDRHYRSTTHTTVSDFQVQRYVSVWENPGDIGAQLRAMTPTNAWGLDELKKVALQGFSSSGQSSHRPEEGKYQSLPLDGRLDLMRPKKIEDSDERTEEEPSGHAVLFADTPGDAKESGAEFSVMDLSGHHQISSPNYAGLTTYNLDHSRRSTGPLDGGLSAGTQQSQPHPNMQSPGQILAQTPSTPQRMVHHGHPPLHASPHFLQAQLQSPERFQIPQFYSNLHFQQSLAESQQMSNSDQGVQLHSSRPPHQLSPVHLRGSAKLVSNSPHRLSHPNHEEPHHSPRSHRRHLAYEPTHSPVEGRDGSDSLVIQAGQEPSQQRFKAGIHSPTNYSHTQHGPLSPRSQRQSLNLQQTGTISPPKIPWNPAVEPPPHVRPKSVFPEDTYFPNIWDQYPSQQHDATFQTFSPPPSSPRTLRSEVFFHPPPPSAIPEHLIKEGRYSGVLGPIDPQDAKGDSPSSPMPDKGKVKSVFPWEEKPRHVPRRIFPTADASPPAHYIEEELAASPPKVSPVQEPDRPRRIPAHFTIPPVPTSLTSPNVWDSVPSIQRYASRLIRPSDIFPQPVIATPENGWRKWEKMRERDWQERQDASSMDGDDEDDGDDDDDLSETEIKNRSGKDHQRRGSSGSATRVKKEYRVRGVQTVSPEKVEEEVQVSILHAQSADGKVTSPPILYQGQLTSQGVGTDLKDDWPPSASASSLLPPAVLRDPNVEHEQVIGSPTVDSQSTLPFPSMTAPTGTRSPVLISPRSYSPPKAASLSKATSPPKVGSPRVSFARPLHGSRRASTSSASVSPALRGSPRGIPSPRPPTSPRAFSAGSLQKPSISLPNTVSRSQQTTPPPKPLSKLSSPFSPQMQRSVSTETTTTISPSTTHSSTLDTPENTPVLGPRKASRVWDPARGIDVFKRGSEEVLARFLRLGSFEEESQKRPAA